MPQRRATSVTIAPGCVASATIRHFCSSDQLRRRSPRVTTSTTSLRVLLRALISILAASVSASMSASVSQRPTTRPYCRGGSLGGAATTRTDEALGDAVALGLADEGGRALDAEEGDLVLEVAGHVVRAMVVAEGETFGHVLLDAAEVAQHALAHRLECLEAVTGARGMVADALAGAVVDGNEDPGPAVSDGHGLGHVGAPHCVHHRGGDGAVMGALLGTADPVRREQAVLAHQPPDPPG